MSIVAVGASGGWIAVRVSTRSQQNEASSRGCLRGAEGSMRKDTFDEPPLRWTRQTSTKVCSIRWYRTRRQSGMWQTSVGNDLRAVICIRNNFSLRPLGGVYRTIGPARWRPDEPMVIRGGGHSEVRRHQIRRSDEFLARSFCADEFAKHGPNSTVAQMNFACSHARGTLRGRAWQMPPLRRSRTGAMYARCHLCCGRGHPAGIRYLQQARATSRTAFRPSPDDTAWPLPITSSPKRTPAGRWSQKSAACPDQMSARHHSTWPARGLRCGSA